MKGQKMNAQVQAECEAKLDKMIARWGELPTARIISKLDILALKALAHSPWQQVIQARRASLRTEVTPIS